MLIFHFLGGNFDSLVSISYFFFPISYFLFLISFFLFLISYFLFLISYFLLLIFFFFCFLFIFFYFLFLAQYIICLPRACQQRPLISGWHHKASHVRGKSDKLTWEKHHFGRRFHILLPFLHFCIVILGKASFCTCTPQISHSASFFKQLYCNT